MNRIKSGIPGLDDMLLGGIPQGHALLVMGAYGTGKTTFALQFLWEGVKNNENCLYLTLEEDEKSIIETANQFGWDIGDNEHFNINYLSPEDIENTVNSLGSEFIEYLKENNINRMVIDSITLLSSLYPNEHEKRKGIFQLARNIKKLGITVLYTAEVDPYKPSVSKDSIVEYICDGVILLEYNPRPSDGSVVLLIRIIKMRRTRHIRDYRVYEITNNGITIMSQAPVI